MQFRTFFTAIIFSACIVGTIAAATAVPEAFIAQAVNLSKQSGCGSVGPLGTGHFKWYITTSCRAGSTYRCQAMDGSGCEPGGTKKVGSLEVDDPNDTFQVTSAKHSNSVDFVCPSVGQIRCQANFEDSNDGPNYSLRVISV